MDNSNKPYIYTTQLVREYTLFGNDNRYYEQTFKREIIVPSGFLSIHSPPYSPMGSPINSPKMYFPMYTN
jgi:hypothetical protein